MTATRRRDPHGLSRRSAVGAGAAAILSLPWIRNACASENGTLTVALSNNVSGRMLRGDYTANLTNSMSPGETTYFLMANWTLNSFMSKVSGNTVDPEVEAALKIAFVETDREKLKPVYAKLMKHMAETAYYTWIGYFAAANLWRNTVKNFKPSRGLTINVHDVAID